MKLGRFFLAFFMMVAASATLASGAHAFWGFGDDTQAGKSGLDFDLGYDRNTETTVRGKVVSLDSGSGSGQLLIAVRMSNGTMVQVVAAPGWFWSDRGIAIKPGEELEATGSSAQGKDGKLYLISRSITNLSQKETVTLRDETGRPDWRGGSRTQRGFGGGQHRMGGGRRR